MQGGITGFQLSTGVDCVMDSVGWDRFQIQVEPVLHPFRPIFLGILSRIGVVISTREHGGIIRRIQFCLETRLRKIQPHEVNGMGKFMDEDAFTIIAIIPQPQTQKIFFRTTGNRPPRNRPESP